MNETSLGTDAPPSEGRLVQPLTVREAAEHGTVSEWLVRGWIADGLLPCYRLGARGRRGHIRIMRDDLDALLATFKVSTPGPEPALAPAPAPAPLVSPPKTAFKHLRFS